ncbi:unnamed protein product [Discosporangium mesarthrocarpum]
MFISLVNLNIVFTLISCHVLSENVSTNLLGSEASAFPLDIGLDGQLCRYGVAINPDLVQDLRSGSSWQLDNQPQLKLLSWPFFPLLKSFFRSFGNQKYGCALCSVCQQY